MGVWREGAGEIDPSPLLWRLYPAVPQELLQMFKLVGDIVKFTCGSSVKDDRRALTGGTNLGDHWSV